MSKRFLLAIPLGGILLAAAALLAAPKKPVYLGARSCGACHDGAGMGYQYSKWLLTKHAKAYAVLSLPESKRIAEISGLREPPWRAPICLGCHATGLNAEDWEKDDLFRIEDGIQCESCHGPGSEYAAEAVMRDKAEAMKNGLRMPNQDWCMGCHIEKGSHVAVLKNPTVDIQKAIQAIAHPMPSNSRMATALKPRGGDWIGSAKCGSCHKGPEHGFQYDNWRMSPHSRAWAALTTPRALEIAKARNVEGPPQASQQCLGCHSVGASPDEGVGCEACHGAGKNYAADAVMRDPAAARKAGLRVPEKNGCNHCHRETHGKTFDLEAAWKALSHPTRLPHVAAGPRYKTPLALSLRPKSSELWVACEASDSVVVVDTRSRKVIAEFATGGAPTDIAFTPDGARAFVTNRQDDTVTAFDAAARTPLGLVKTGDEPHGIRTDREGKLVYALNTSSDDITVFDSQSLQHVKTLAGGRGPWALALSPDGNTFLVSNMYSHLTGARQNLRSEVTVIDAASGRVSDRYPVPGANLMMSVAWHPSGRYGIATLNRTKNLVPMTRLLQGWTITNGIAVVFPNGRVDQLLLDQPGLGFADAAGVTFTPDGRYALVTSSGTNRVAVIDTAKLIALLQATPKERRETVLPNHLGQSAAFVVKYLDVLDAPRAVLAAPDNTVAYVANSRDDSLSLIDLRTLAVAGRVDLGGPKEITKARFGERMFHSASVSFHRQLSCSSCHPDGHVDGITYDIEADGIGISPVDNRTLRGILDTAPFKWEGTNPTIGYQCGPRLSVFFTRLHPLDPEQLAAVEEYITTIPRPPNRYHTPGEPYTPAQRRGKLIFERTTAADGRAIPNEGQCIYCHYPPYFTVRRRFDVGTRQANDRTGLLDVPHLNNIYDSAPYLHNGMARTLEEIWTVCNPYDKHGFTNDLTKDQLNDLIEYIKTL
jgi:YVTN family beta-propeller protein